VELLRRHVALPQKQPPLPVAGDGDVEHQDGVTGIATLDQDVARLWRTHHRPQLRLQRRRARLGKHAHQPLFEGAADIPLAPLGSPISTGIPLGTASRKAPRLAPLGSPISTGIPLGTASRKAPRLAPLGSPIAPLDSPIGVERQLARPPWIGMECDGRAARKAVLGPQTHHRVGALLQVARRHVEIDDGRVHILTRLATAVVQVHLGARRLER
jgi:hypothetical protein